MGRILLFWLRVSRVRLVLLQNHFLINGDLFEEIIDEII